MSTSMKHKCGVFGVWGRSDAAHLTYLAMFAQQHRGQEAAGMAVTNGRDILSHVGTGLVGDVFSPQIVNSLKGHSAIGHNRYSTTGSSISRNIQPFVREYVGGQVALAHNGNLINADLLREDYERRGHIFQTSSDTESILHLLAYHHVEKDDPLSASLLHLQGAYSLVFLFADRIEAARDPWGWRPLVIGRLPDEAAGGGEPTNGAAYTGAYCVASETVALDVIGAQYVREVEPGEIVRISDAGLESRRFADPQTPARCIFEHVYFANPSSYLFGDRVQLVREKMGEMLAREAPVQADCVLPMPDSGRSAAMGYARESGIELREGIVPNRYVGRSFIKPTQAQRHQAVTLKLNPVREIISGKRVIVVDDSIVRGTTTREKMAHLRRAGAREIHLRISCPPIRNACYFGIDFADPGQLIAAEWSVDEIRESLGVDSLHYLSLDGMLSCVGRPANEYCNACFTGDYPIPVDKPVSKLGLERFQMRMFADTRS